MTDRPSTANRHEQSKEQPAQRRRAISARSLLRLTSVLVVVVLALAAVVGIARSVRSASTGDEVATSAGTTVWQPVDRGVLELTVSFTSTGAAPDVISLGSPVAGRVLDVGLDVGDQVDNGELVAVIDGRPLIAVEADVFVPYRDLSLGDVGPDVSELQALLTELGYYEQPIDRRFGRGLRSAVEAFYENFGLEGQRSFLADTVVVIKAPIAVRAIQLARGDVLGIGDELLSYGTGTDVARGSIADEESGRFEVGTVVELQSSDGSFDGRVSELSDVVESAQGTPSRLVEVEADDGLIVVGRNYRVSTIVEATDGEVLLVPALAVQTAPDGRTFVNARPPASNLERFTDVVVVLSDGRQVAVEAEGLSAGWEVEVPR